MEDYKKAKLFVGTEKLGTVTEVANFLTDLSRTYNRILAYEILNEQKLDAREYLLALSNIEKGYTSKYLNFETKLEFLGAEFLSSGKFIFSGVASVIAEIRKCIENKHDTEKDRAYRSRQEEERGDLINQKERITLLEKEIQIMKENGFTDSEIQTKVKSVFEVETSKRLLKYIGTGYINVLDYEE
ncbi:MAG: hypothetical protein LBN34_07395 [Clostridiales Family XIII bacterium]|jgi:hypothetical protein|nr:hypothetical protein [Clostridiales Family XIII bacterium]